MKSKKLLLGISAIMLIFVLVLTGCENTIQEKNGGSDVPAVTSGDLNVTYTLVKGGVLFTWPLVKDANGYQVLCDGGKLTAAVTLVNSMYEYTASTKDLKPDTPYTYEVIALKDDKDIGKWEKIITPKISYPAVITLQSDGVGSVTAKIAPGAPSYETEPLKIKQIVPDFSEAEGTWPANSPIVIFFDDAIYEGADGANIKNSFKITVSGEDEEGNEVKEDVLGTISISSTVDNFGFPNAILTFTPYEPFDIGKDVEIKINGLEDKCGNQMSGGGVTIGFTAEKPNITEGSFTNANWGFEAGMAGVEFLGDGNIISGNGTLQPKSGSKVAAITTGYKKVSPNNSIGSKSSIMKLGPVYTDFTRLSFWYNFMSAEFNTWVGTKYNDEATITIDGPKGKVSVSLTSVTKIGKRPESKKCSGTIAYGYETGMTQFVLNKINVGTPAYITFMVSDIGDTVVDSILAVDDIVLSEGGGDDEVTFNSATASGISSTNAQLLLTFSQAIPELSAADITVTGAAKGALSGNGPNYILPISGFTAGNELTIAVSKASSGSPKTVTINPPSVPVTFNYAGANGSQTLTTTQLSLTFSNPISGLTADDIILSGVSGVEKGVLSGIESIYSLPISGFTAGGELTIEVVKTGYIISGSPKKANIYYSGSGGNNDNVFSSISGMSEWLAVQPANTKDKPYTVKLNTDEPAYNIGNALKSNNTKYVSLDLSGSNFTSIGGEAFYNCASLAILVIPASVTSIESGAFYGCANLTAINASAANSAYSSQDGVLYNKNKTILVIYPAGKTGAFTIPTGVTGIGMWAFSSCISLTSVTIPTGVTGIESSAFYNCTILAVITIPDSVTSIGSDAFTNTAWLNGKDNGLVYAGKVLYKYKGTMPSNTSITITTGTIGITGYAFNACTGLVSVTIPASVTSIGSYAFNGCTGLISVKFEGTITSDNFGINNTFPGDLRTKYLADNGGKGTYTRPNGTSTTWTKQGTNDGSFTSIEAMAAWLAAQPENDAGTAYAVKLNVGNLGSWPNTAGNALRDNATKFVKLDLSGSTLTIINEAAFYDCTSLTGVTISINVTSIDNDAFRGCTNLASITIPESSVIRIIGTEVFTGTAWLNNQPNGLVYIGKVAYTYKGAMTANTSITLLEGTKGIAAVAFRDCANLTGITIPASVTSIELNAFMNCTGLTTITIPASVNIIWYGAFYGCTNLTSVTFEGGVISEFISNAFPGDLQAKYLADNGGAGTYTTTAPVSNSSVWTKQGSGENNDGPFTSLKAFADWYAVQTGGTNPFNPLSAKLNIDSLYDSVNYITVRSVLLDDQTKYISLDFSDSNFTSIGDGAFTGCTTLISVTIGSSVTSIYYDNAFNGCTNLTAINAADDNSAYISQDGVLYNKNKTSLVKYPAGKAGAIIIPANVTRIESSAFNGCTSLSITIPDSVTSIGAYAFNETAWLNNQPNNSLVYAGKVAYTYKGTMPANTNITLLEGTKGIAGRAFMSRTTLASVTIPNSVTNIGDYAFYMTSLTSVIIPNSVTSIGDWAFSSCTSLTSVTFDRADNTIIGSDAFINAVNTTSLQTAYTAGGKGTYTRPNTTSTTWTKQGTNDGPFTSIEAMAAWLSAQPENDAGTAYAVKLNVGDLGGYATVSGSAGYALAANSTKYVDLDLSGSTFSTINDRAFLNCTNLTSLILPSSLSYIDANDAFNGCTNLTSVTFQSAIAGTYIQDSAFLGDLKTKYTDGGTGTYTTTAPVSSSSVWTKQN